MFYPSVCVIVDGPVMILLSRFPFLLLHDPQHPCQALVDDGATHICEACPAGQQQLGAGAVSCNACPTGTSKAVKSTEECAPCPAGTWGGLGCHVHTTALYASSNCFFFEGMFL